RSRVRQYFFPRLRQPADRSGLVRADRLAPGTSQPLLELRHRLCRRVRVAAQQLGTATASRAIAIFFVAARNIDKKRGIVLMDESDVPLSSPSTPHCSSNPVGLELAGPLLCGADLANVLRSLRKE